MAVKNQSAAATREHFMTGSLTSKDGTSIGYREYGHGPGVVLVQGAMGFADNFSELAEALSDTFTVYVPDRRGRGMSPLPYNKDHTIQRDVEDLEALLTKTAAQYVFALSSGAVIALTAAIGSTAIHKLAVFEPPLYEGRPLPTAEQAHFDKAIAQGNIAAALTAAGKAVDMVPMLKYIPNWVLNFLTNKMLASEAKQVHGDDPTLSEITLTLQYDFRIVTEMHGALNRWRDIQAEVLLLGGGKSPVYLRTDLDALEKILPHVKRVTFPDLGHAAAWNYDHKRNPTGNPEAVAQELRRFFVNGSV